MNSADIIETAKQTLWDLRTGEQAILKSYDASLSKEYEQRVLELGFRPDALVKCLRSSALGAPKVYQVNNSVFSMEDSIASKIYVNLQGE